MKKQFVLASRNKGKLKELQELLTPLDVELRSVSDYSDDDVEETAATFVENALLKARFACMVSGLPAIADDSGLCVDALGGEPGLYSARYAGEPCCHEKNVAKLLDKMQGLPAAKRGAAFICVIVALNSATDPLPIITEGSWRGLIAEAPKGDGGFAYDPIFYLPEHGLTSAELTSDEKNEQSHRGLAVANFVDVLKNLPA